MAKSKKPLKRNDHSMVSITGPQSQPRTPITRSRKNTVPEVSVTINPTTSIEPEIPDNSTQRSTPNKRQSARLLSSSNNDASNTEEQPDNSIQRSTPNKRKRSLLLSSLNDEAPITHKEPENEPTVVIPEKSKQQPTPNKRQSPRLLSSSNKYDSNTKEQPDNSTQRTTPNKRKRPLLISSLNDESTITNEEPEHQLTNSKEQHKPPKQQQTAIPPTTSKPRNPPQPSNNEQKKKHVVSSSTDAATSDTPQVPTNTTATSPKMTKQRLLASKAVEVLSHLDPATTLCILNRKTKFQGPRTLHWPTLEELKLDNEFKEWLTGPWKKLFEINRPVYKKLIFEFFSTYKFNKKATSIPNLTKGPVMQFSLGGKVFNLSFKEFAVAMNLYSDNEVEGDDFESGLIGWPSDETASNFWTTFGSGQYEKNISCTTIKIPSYRILHRLVSESINQRGSSTQHVTQEDMFYMYCITNNKPCNIAVCLARYLFKSHGKTEASAVCGGSYITQLAVGLKAVTEEQLIHMEQLVSTTYFDIAQLRILKVIHKGLPLRFVDAAADSDKNEEEDATTPADIASRLTSVEEKVHALKADYLSLKGEVHWVSEALHYLIGKFGHSFAPPPHVLAQASGSNPSTGPASP